MNCQRESYNGTNLNVASTCFWGEKSPHKAAADGAAENIRVISQRGIIVSVEKKREFLPKNVGESPTFSQLFHFSGPSRYTWCCRMSVCKSIKCSQLSSHDMYCTPTSITYQWEYSTPVVPHQYHSPIVHSIILDSSRFRIKRFWNVWLCWLCKISLIIPVYSLLFE